MKKKKIKIKTLQCYLVIFLFNKLFRLSLGVLFQNCVEKKKKKLPYTKYIFFDVNHVVLVEYYSCLQCNYKTRGHAVTSGILKRVNKSLNVRVKNTFTSVPRGLRVIFDKKKKK